MSKDLIGISGGLNQYVFCGNNPVNFVDPYGLCTPEDKFSILKPKNERYVTGFKDSRNPLFGDRSLLMKAFAHLLFVHEYSQRHDRQVKSLPGPFIIRNIGTLPTAAVETVVAGVSATGAKVADGGLKWEF